MAAAQAQHRGRRRAAAVRAAAQLGGRAGGTVPAAGAHQLAQGVRGCRGTGAGEGAAGSRGVPTPGGLPAPLGRARRPPGSRWAAGCCSGLHHTCSVRHGSPACSGYGVWRAGHPGLAIWGPVRLCCWRYRGWRGPHQRREAFSWGSVQCQAASASPPALVCAWPGARCR